MTKKQQTALIVGNWKMHPGTLREAEVLFSNIKNKLSRTQGAKVVICPPTLYLGALLKSYRGSTIGIGAQDAYWENKGSHTGMVSPKMLSDLGVSYVILGHSEKRKAGETNVEVAQKVVTARATGLTVFLCIGEPERDPEGAYLGFLEKQILASLEGVSKQRFARNGVYITYEPLWAIGKNFKEALSAGGIHQMSLFIKKIIAKKYGSQTARKTGVLYGGSVEEENIQEILVEGEVDGVLVGHASLNTDEFTSIVKKSTQL
jgi:triosephosphate isomerase